MQALLLRCVIKNNGYGELKNKQHSQAAVTARYFSSIPRAFVFVARLDSFTIDKGYHPVSAEGGYQVYYLWFMAGETGRTLRPYDDPDHKWLL
jgi:5-deoxy-D-glucuronate isomerase